MASRPVLFARLGIELRDRLARVNIEFRRGRQVGHAEERLDRVRLCEVRWHIPTLHSGEREEARKKGMERMCEE